MDSEGVAEEEVVDSEVDEAVDSAEVVVEAVALEGVVVVGVVLAEEEEEASAEVSEEEGDERFSWRILKPFLKEQSPLSNLHHIGVRIMLHPNDVPFQGACSTRHTKPCRHILWKFHFGHGQ